MRAPGRKQWSSPRYQRGVAAVELAILSMVMFFFLTAPLLIARSLMQATVAQRAAFNAAHMLATYPQYLRLDPAYAPIDQSKAMLIETLDDSALGPVADGDINISCVSSANCNKSSSPTNISIILSVNVLDPSTIVPSLANVQLSISSADRYTN